MGSHDIDYHYKLHNIGMHLEMMRYIPHLKPLVPELKADFESATAKWQDIVDEILGEKEDESIECEKEEEIETSEKTETYSSSSGIESKTTKISTKKQRQKQNINEKRLEVIK